MLDPLTSLHSCLTRSVYTRQPYRISRCSLRALNFPCLLILTPHFSPAKTSRLAQISTQSLLRKGIHIRRARLQFQRRSRTILPPSPTISSHWEILECASLLGSQTSTSSDSTSLKPSRQDASQMDARYGPSGTLSTPFHSTYDCPH